MMDMMKAMTDKVDKFGEKGSEEHCEATVSSFPKHWSRDSLMEAGGIQLVPVSYVLEKKVRSIQLSMCIWVLNTAGF